MYLIREENIRKYIVKNHTVNGITYDTIFRYTGVPITDFKGEGLSHEVEVGFKDPSGKEFVNRLYLPIRTKDGLLSKDKVLWYDIYMVIPPLSYYEDNPNRKNYFGTLLSTDIGASTLDDFFPKPTTMNFTPNTPLMKELKPKEAVEFGNINNWHPLELELAIIEMFNYKITADIRRSQRKGFAGVYASVRSIHTLCRAFCRYHTNTDVNILASGTMTVLPEEMTFLGNIGTADKQGNVFIHPLIKRVSINEKSPIDFCSCNQNLPIRTGRLKDGITAERGKFKGEITFPYAEWRRAIVGITSDDPRRVIVSRSITRALKLDKPSEPYALTETVLDVDSLSLPGTRLTHPLTHEDGMIVSETFAERAGAFKLHVDSFSIPESADVNFLKEEYKDSDVKQIAKSYSRSREHRKYSGPYSINRGDGIAVIQYPGLNREAITSEIRSKVKSTGIVVRIERFMAFNDLDEASISYRVVSLVYYPLEVGDKLADAHGNKSTVSAVWPDIKMPVWESGERNIRLHYLATPFVMKRLAIGAEIEDKLALYNYMQEVKASESGEEDYDMEVVHSDEYITLDEAEKYIENLDINYVGKISIEGTESNVPICMRSIFRLDNNIRDTVNTVYDVEGDEYKRLSRNAKMGIDITTMLSRGADKMVNHIISGSESRKYMKKTVLPFLYAVSGRIPEGAQWFEITAKINRELLGNPYSYEALSEIDFTNTACDPRLGENHYGVINLGKHGRVVLPPGRHLTDLGNGTAILSRISVYANRVMAEKESVERGFTENTDIPLQMTRYSNALSSVLSGKRGLLREVLFPVFPTTIRSVATACDTDDPLKIYIPKSEFKRLIMKNHDMRDIYAYKKDWYCVLKRDPVHDERSVITVKFDVWDNKSIGVSPLLITCLQGDFDGDTLFAMFPVDRGAHEDMAKLIPDFSDIYTPSKHLEDTDASDCILALKERIGWSSTFMMPHFADSLKNAVLFNKLSKGIESNDLQRECVAAARDFEIIKDGTASAGALGLSFVFSRNPEQKHILSGAMYLYHLLAQNTLNAKAGTDVPALKVIDSVYSGKKDLIMEGLSELGFHDKECIQQFLEFTDDIIRAGSRMALLTKQYPVLASTQTASTGAQIATLSEKLVSGEDIGQGFWETMAKYLLDVADNTPFNWAEIHPEDIFETIV